jgi:hypothetical protein
MLFVCRILSGTYVHTAFVSSLAVKVFTINLLNCDQVRRRCEGLQRRLSQRVQRRSLCRQRVVRQHRHARAQEC